MPYVALRFVHHGHHFKQGERIPAEWIKEIDHGMMQVMLSSKCLLEVSAAEADKMHAEAVAHGAPQSLTEEARGAGSNQGLPAENQVAVEVAAFLPVAAEAAPAPEPPTHPAEGFLRRKKKRG
jgi:hypothetical protein